MDPIVIAGIAGIVILAALVVKLILVMSFVSKGLPRSTCRSSCQGHQPESHHETGQHLPMRDGT